MRQARFPITSAACGLVLATGASSPAHAVLIQVGGPQAPSLAAAIAAVPAMRARLRPGEAIEIVLPRGVARLSGPVVIDAAHGGTDAAPLVIRGSGADASRLVGSVPLVPRPAKAGDVGGAAPPAGAVALDLASLPIGANLVRRGAYLQNRVAGIELYQGARRLTPSRWPAVGLATAAALNTDPAAALIAVPNARAAAWRGEAAAWAGGYWGADWAFELAPVVAVAPSGAALRLAPLQGRERPRGTARYFVENLLAELRAPGTFFVDPARKLALVVPFAGSGPIEAAVAPSLLVLKGARNVRISGIAFDRSLGPAVQVVDGEGISFAGCAFRQTGGTGVIVSGGHDVVISRSVVAQTAEGGVLMTGGDRASLTPGGHVFTDGIVDDFGLESPSYHPAVRLFGVGNAVRGSLLTGGDHNAVMLSGNDLVVEGNEIAHVLRDTEDAGAIYMGADWSERGMRIVGNYVHDLGGPRPTRFLSSVYLDDQASGALVAGNVLVGGDYGVVIGGGRDDRIEHNLIVGPRQGGIHFDARGRGQGQADRPNATFAAKLARMPVGSAPWRARYPALATLTPDRYGAPDGDAAIGNAVLGAPVVVAAPDDVAPLLAQSGNSGSPAAMPQGSTALAGLTRARAMPPLATRVQALAGLLPLLQVPAR